MFEKSEPLYDKIEIIETKPLSELLSEAIIKVCYVSEIPNRNGTVINKTVGRDIASYLPGAPVVGYFKKTADDFQGHDGIYKIVEGGIEYVDLTRPYGFVSLDNPWYQDFLEDGIARTYLMCKAYLWTRQYEEALKIIGKGQSMELNEQDLDGYYEGEHFVFTHAAIDKLCILGDETPPCFEGSGFLAKYSKRNMDFTDELESILGRRYKVVNGKLVNKDDKSPAAITYAEGGEPAPAPAPVAGAEGESNNSEGTPVSGDSTPTSTSEPTPEPISESVLQSEPQSEPQSELVSESQLEPVLASVQTPEPQLEPKPELKSETELQLEPQPELEPEKEKKVKHNSEIIEGLKSQIAELQAQVNAFKSQQQAIAETQKITIVDSYKDLLSEEEINSVRNDLSKLSTEEVESKLAIILANKVKAEKAEKAKIGSSQVQLNVSNLSSDSRGISNLPDFMVKALKIDEQNNYI